MTLLMTSTGKPYAIRTQTSNTPPPPKADANKLAEQQIQATSSLRQFCFNGTIDSSDKTQALDVAAVATHITKIVLYGRFENDAIEFNVRTRYPNGSTKENLVKAISPDIVVGIPFSVVHYNLDFNPAFIVQQDGKTESLLSTISVSCTAISGTEFLNYAIFGYHQDN